LRDEITKQATAKDRVRASMLLESWQTAPCRWAEVFPMAGNASKPE
jgi:hypothetical protein